MRNLICAIFLIFLSSSCKVAQVSDNNMIGTYVAIGKDYNYRLLLNADKTFDLKFTALDAKSGCEGKWDLKDSDLLVLSCNEPNDMVETLRSGYMSQRIQEVKIKSRDKLIYNNSVTLKRIP